MVVIDEVNRRGYRLTPYRDPASKRIRWAIFNHGGPRGAKSYRVTGVLKWKFSNRKHAEMYLNG